MPTFVKYKGDAAMSRILAVVYGAVCYLVFLPTSLYAVGFIGGWFVPKTLDSGAALPWQHALLADALLLGVFALQHSVMARPAFKRWWTAIVPAHVERSTYVLLTSLALLLLFWQWQPLPAIVWDVAHPAGRALLVGLCWLGWAIVLASTFFINHFDLFGLRQVVLHLRKQPYTDLPFTRAMLYKFVRHPLMLGFVIAFWAAPRMSVGHLVFALGGTGYILVGLWLEERELLAAHGEAYRQYHREVPMLFPLPRKRA